jgi:hypothetical protein
MFVAETEDYLGNDGVGRLPPLQNRRRVPFEQVLVVESHSADFAISASSSAVNCCVEVMPSIKKSRVKSPRSIKIGP